MSGFPHTSQQFKGTNKYAETGCAGCGSLEHSHAESVSQEDRSSLVGRRGVTVTPLRPIGRVRFGSDEVDVMTEGEYVDSDQEVEVMSVEGPRVVVRIPDAT